MFLYLLNETEGIAFLELAYLAMEADGIIKECETAEFDNFKTELSLDNYQLQHFDVDKAIEMLKDSSFPVKRSIIIELCGILYADNEIDNAELKWIYYVAEKLNLKKEETERLVRWSKDFSDFVEVGLMYINS